MDIPEHFKAALSLLDKDGPLSLCLKGFEPREQQQQMLLKVLEAYENKAIALIEAGTGTGKSLAYLIPAILWALRFHERTVISTHTINLQEQLIEKDIPLLLKAWKPDVKAVLVKGMGNYICLRKIEEARHELRLMSNQEADELDKIEAWSQTTRDGSRSSLPLVPSSATWERVGAEHDTCNRNTCEYFKECFYFKARRQAEDAQILVVNHHLLCSDLIRREETSGKDKTGVLPDYTRVILDEAHHFEEVATDYFAHEASLTEIYRILHRISADNPGESIGKLNVLRLCLLNIYKKDPPAEVALLLRKLSHDIPGQRWDVWHAAQDAFEACSHFALMLQKSTEETTPGELTLRLLPLHQTHPDWQKKIIPKIKHLTDLTEKLSRELISLDQDVKQLKNEKLKEMSAGVLFDINSLSSKLSNINHVLINLIESAWSKNKVRWISVQSKQRGQNTSLIEADLDVSKALAETLFNKLGSVVLCSATLATNHQFNFIRHRLGLVPELLASNNVSEHIYDSPFDFSTQALLAIPSDIPHPTHPDFISSATEHIWQAVQASRGNAFVLFTSYGMLQTCYDSLSKRMKEGGYHPLRQGEGTRQALLNKFKKTDRSVLFGTDSFWEGVDVAGEALRCVIIVKLPFKVPTEPLVQARSEAIAADGGDPFFEYALPNAIVKFKQGFGRLIRHRRDRGCIICLDNRLLTKGYGKIFFDSLPNCQRLFEKTSDLYPQICEFYKKTYRLVKA